MEKQIAYIRYKMIGLVTALACLGAWQHEFIIEGVKSHVEVTSTILLTFGFSIVMSFIFISKLKPEIIAFKALREMWDDIRVGPKEQEKDPFWRHYRCAEQARVFQRPRLLGHAYDLVTEELARTKKIRISVETMNTLVHKIEETINAEKSLIVYLSGLLVFMGLIGTFIGLLHMVGSIGGIIGSLAKSSSGASSGAFAELLGALQEPLKGMASGFAASLFGLFSSLVVGLLGRMAGQAAGVLKNEFESWLAGVVQIGEDEYEPTPAETVNAAPNPALVKLLGDVLLDYSRVAGSFDSAARLLTDMRGAQQEQTQVTAQLAAEIGRLQVSQSRMIEQLASSSALAPALRELSGGVERLGETVAKRIESDIGSMRNLVLEQSRSQASTLRTLSANQAESTAQIAEALSLISTGLERRSGAGLDPQLVEAAIERSLRSGLDMAGRSVAAPLGRIEAQTISLAATMERLSTVGAEAGASGASGELREVARAVEAGMSEGFARINASVETAFAAYSNLLKVSIQKMDDAEEQNARPAPAPDPEEAGISALAALAAQFREREGGGRILNRRDIA